MIAVFGGNDFLTKATNHLGLRGYVLDKKFGLRYVWHEKAPRAIGTTTS